MKPRRWIVRHYALSLIRATIELDAEPTLLIERSFRWRWLARVDCWISNHTPPIGPIGATTLFWATLDEARPRLTVIDGGKR